MTRLAVPDYRGAPGSLSALALRCEDATVCHVLMFMLSASEATIAAFAGTDLTAAAKYHDFGREFLLGREPTVDHYRVTGAEFSEDTIVAIAS